jgi:hypothetical protein
MIFNILLSKEWIIVRNKSFAFILAFGEVVAIESGFINEHVAKSLCFRDGFSGVVNQFFKVEVKSELEFLNGVSDTEEGECCTFNDSYVLFLLVDPFLMVSSYRDEDTT